MSIGELNIGDLSIGASNIGGTNIGDVDIVVLLLSAAAVLVWPTNNPVSAVGGGGAGAPAGQDHTRAGAGVDARAAVVRSVVPVAEVAGVIDLLALTLRGGVGLVEAMEAVAARVGGPLDCICGPWRQPVDGGSKMPQPGRVSRPHGSRRPEPCGWQPLQVCPRLMHWSARPMRFVAANDNGSRWRRRPWASASCCRSGLSSCPRSSSPPSCRSCLLSLNRCFPASEHGAVPDRHPRSGSVVRHSLAVTQGMEIHG